MKDKFFVLAVVLLGILVLGSLLPAVAEEGDPVNFCCPDPKDIVNLVEGTAFVVPLGKFLIIRDFAISKVPKFPPTGSLVDVDTQFSVSADLVVVWETGGNVFYQLDVLGSQWGTSTTAVQQTPLDHLSLGVRIDEEKSVTINSLVGTAYASGYLSNL